VQKLVYWVCDNWERPDYSIWEMRRKPEQFVYSKMQCWVALDRGMRIAQKRNLPLDFDRVRKESNVIYETIMHKGWSESRHSFVQYFGSEAVDATCLLYPLMLFVSSKDPRMTTTLDRVLKEIVSDSLVYRYELGKAVGDGLPGVEGTFSVCTFWLVEVLARAGRVDEARFIFEKMLTYANHLGLYAERNRTNRRSARELSAGVYSPGIDRRPPWI
jgi:GH15 family glucan-1,4-alpha-glucosidase